MVLQLMKGIRRICVWTFELVCVLTGILAFDVVAEIKVPAECLTH